MAAAAVCVGGGSGRNRVCVARCVRHVICALPVERGRKHDPFVGKEPRDVVVVSHEEQGPGSVHDHHATARAAQQHRRLVMPLPSRCNNIIAPRAGPQLLYPLVYSRTHSSTRAVLSTLL